MGIMQVVSTPYDVVNIWKPTRPWRISYTFSQSSGQKIIVQVQS